MDATTKNYFGALGAMLGTGIFGASALALMLGTNHTLLAVIGTVAGIVAAYMSAKLMEPF